MTGGTQLCLHLPGTERQQLRRLSMLPRCVISSGGGKRGLEEQNNGMEEARSHPQAY